MPTKHVNDERTRRKTDGPDELIVIGPRALVSKISRITQTRNIEVMIFATLRELDQWRAESSEDQRSLEVDILDALNELGLSPTNLDSGLWTKLQAVGKLRYVPHVNDLVALYSTRRAFYRAWIDSIPEPPSTFLRRVRILRATRLLDEGQTPSAAAANAGFGSSRRLRRALKDAHIKSIDDRVSYACDRLEPAEERALAEELLEGELPWPPY